MFPYVSTEALVCALVLSEEGNLSRTADRLHTSTFNVSGKVGYLQASWSVQLFSRSLTGVELSEEGRVSRGEIRKSINYAQRGFDRATYHAVRNRKPFSTGHSLYIHGKVQSRQAAVHCSALSWRPACSRPVVPLPCVQPPCVN
jgi:hypothetical protein